MSGKMDLPRDLSFQIHAETPPAERQITLENLRELIMLAPQPWRSMLLVKWHGIMDTEALIYTSNHYSELLVDAIKKGQELIKLSIPGRKKRRNKQPFYTFIGAEPLERLRDYFERDRGYPGPGEPVWLNRQKGTRMTKRAFEAFWLRHLRRAALVPESTGDTGSGYGFNVHNTRDLAMSVLATVPNLKPVCPEFWAGHTIDPLQCNQFYNVKPQWATDQYRIAEPYLNILTQATQTEPTLEVALKVLANEKLLQEAIEVARKREANAGLTPTTESSR